MGLQKKVQPEDKPILIDGKNNSNKNKIAEEAASPEALLKEPESRPRRNPILHWVLSVLSLVSVKVSAMRDGIKMFLQNKVHSHKKLITSDNIIAKSAMLVWSTQRH